MIGGYRLVSSTKLIWHQSRAVRGRVITYVREVRACSILLPLPFPYLLAVPSQTERSTVILKARSMVAVSTFNSALVTRDRLISSLEKNSRIDPSGLLRGVEYFRETSSQHLTSIIKEIPSESSLSIELTHGPEMFGRGVILCSSNSSIPLT